MKEFTYKIVKNAITPDLAEFCSNYLMLKRECYFTLKKITDLKKLIPFVDMGAYPDNQCKNAYAIYGDIAMETLLVTLKPICEKIVKKKLICTYAFARIYENGSELPRHKDREECDFSTTLNLGGDKWPIYLDPDSSSGISNDNEYIKGNNKGIEINLSQGDMLIYRGSKFEHWREPFDKTYCSQVFLHYNNYTDKSNIFDKRIHLGLPSYMRGLKIT